MGIEFLFDGGEGIGIRKPRRRSAPSASQPEGRNPSPATNLPVGTNWTSRKCIIIGTWCNEMRSGNENFQRALTRAILKLMMDALSGYRPVLPPNGLI